MEFETGQNHFLSNDSFCCHPEILLLWQRDVTTSLYSVYMQFLTLHSQLICRYYCYYIFVSCST